MWKYEQYRGYYTVARKYEIYLRVEKIFFPQEDILHIFKPTCNFLFYYIDMSVSKIKKKLDEKERKTKE